MQMKAQCLYTLPVRVLSASYPLLLYNSNSTNISCSHVQNSILQARTKSRRSEDPTRPNLGQEEFREQISP